MALEIPDLHSNAVFTVLNSAAGSSAKSTFALGFRHDATISAAVMNTTGNIVRDALRVLWDNSWSIGPIHWTYNDSGVLHVYDDGTVELGTAAASVYTSPAISLIVSKQTGLLGKGHRGRIYLPGLAESDVDEGGVILSGSVTSRQTIFDTMITALRAVVGIEEVVLFHDEDTPGAGGPDVVTNFLVRSTVGTMRPRQRR